MATKLRTTYPRPTQSSLAWTTSIFVLLIVLYLMLLCSALSAAAQATNDTTNDTTNGAPTIAEQNQSNPSVSIEHHMLEAAAASWQQKDAAARPAALVNTTLQDFALPGTQPNSLLTPLADSATCMGCHVNHITQNYAGSMMANSARDPLFRAALQVANADAGSGGELCIRCHSPNGWLNGRATPSDGSALNAEDLQGISCSACHRMVPHRATAGEAAGDAAERAALAGPLILGSGAYIVDRNDVRRGPFTVSAPHGTAQTSYLRSAEMCATCHDIDNPLLTFNNGMGEFVLNALNTPAANGDRLFPVERTYSEWKASDFANGGVYGLDYPGIRRSTGTDFGPITVCQDCHMPLFDGPISNGGPTRQVAKHQWAGGNSVWQQGIANLWLNKPLDTRFDYTQTLNSQALGDEMLKRAATLQVSVVDGQLQVLVTNNTGHKLPTGYAEGRRMWIQVIQSNAGTPVFTSGSWTGVQGELIADPYLKVYEIKQGISDAHAQNIGKPELAGEGFHFILNNKIFKDNRIPPRGFNNAAFAARDMQPVDYTYADGSYQDITTYPIMTGTTQVDVLLYYQTASAEYLDFLEKEADVTVNDAVLGPINWATTLKNMRAQSELGKPVQLAKQRLVFTHFVATDSANATDSGDCENPVVPCKTINYALSRADYGDEVRVAAGIYNESVVISTQLRLTGGFSPNNWTTPNWTEYPTIIDGQNVRRPVQITTALANGTIFDGFVLRNGNATNGNRSGGGMLIDGFIDAATIINTRLENNVASTIGNGSGGGLAAQLGNIFMSPTRLTLTNVTAVNNQASTGDLGAAGGGMTIFAVGNSPLNIEMTNVTVMSNTAGAEFSSQGGGMSLSLQGGTATVRQSKIVGNRTAQIPTFLGGPSGGGGIAMSDGHLHLENVLIARNSADRGGALWFDTSNSVTANFTYTTIADNNLAPGLAQSAIAIRTFEVAMALTNTLVSGNAIAFEADNNPNLTTTVQMNATLLGLDVTTVMSGTVVTSGTPLRGAPAYTNAGLGDYRLTSGSAALDAGMVSLPNLDLDGATRPRGAKPDIGAYEFQQAPQSITFGQLSDKALNNPSFVLSATASSNLPITFSSSTPAVCTINVATVTLVATGTCTIVATQAGNANFSAAPAVTRSFAVTSASKQDQGITFTQPADKVFGDAPFALNATASSNLPVSFSSNTPTICTVSGNTVTLIGVGTCTIVATQTGNDTFNPATPQQRSFSVGSTGKQSQTINFSQPSDKTLGDAPFVLSASATPSNLPVLFSSVTPNVCTVSGNTVTLVAVGECTISATQDGNALFNAATPVTQSFMVQSASSGGGAQKVFLPMVRR